MMLRRFFMFLTIAGAVVVMLFACSSDPSTTAGLELVITSNLGPADLDVVHLEVAQETAPGRFGTPLIANDFLIPTEATFPATFSIASGAAPDQNVLIRVIGRKGGTALVLREVQLQVPKTRVAALTLVLAASCAHQVRIDATGAVQSSCANPEESCQPDTGACGPTKIDVALLPDYTPGFEADSALPTVVLDAGDARDVGASPEATVEAAALKSDKEITRFTIAGVDGTISGSNIGLTLPNGTDVKHLAPTIELDGAKVSPESGAAQDFTLPAIYTVTAEDGSIRPYAVSVSVAAASAKEITQFTVVGGSTVITGTNIAITVPNGTNVTNLAPAVTISGSSVSPAVGVPQNFSSPIVYTVTAADGSTQAYTVTIIVAASNAKAITQFSIQGVNGAITGQNIIVTMPPGTSLASLTPTITISGSKVVPASGAAQSFGSPVTYTVTAADSSTVTYSVTVNVAQSTAKDITQFSIQGVSGTISGTNISLTLPAGSNRASLTPTITTTGTSVSPASGVVRDFTNPVTYSVTAQDASTQTYSVTVSVAASSSKDITSFQIQGVFGTISGANIALTLPSGTDRTNLIPTVVTTGVNVIPAGGTAQNFSSGAVTYTVIAQDGSSKAYFITVSVAASSAKDITAFTVNGTAGTISGTTISVTLTSAADISSVAPAIVTTGVSVSPASGSTQNFSSGPVTYTVTAEDGSTKAYQATVTQTTTAVAPTANVAAGTYHRSQLIILTTSTPGAVIRYTIDGTDPTPSSPSYSGPITVMFTTTVKAYALATGYQPSPVAVMTYTIIAVCGDGLIAGAEQCDDGNSAGGDGCSSACQLESGYFCGAAGQPCAPYSLTVNPTIVDFGLLSCGTSATQTIALINNGPATTWSAQSDGGVGVFTVTPLSGPVAYGDETNLTVVATMKSTTSISTYSELFGATDGNIPGQHKDFSLKARAQGAILVFNTASHAFPSTPSGSTSASFGLQVTNNGNVTVNVTVNLSSSEFAATPTSFSMAASGTQTVSVTFKPTSSGAKTGSISLSAPAPLCAPLPSATLSGTGS